MTVMLYPTTAPYSSEPLIALYGTVVSIDTARKTVVLSARNPYAPALSARFEVKLSNAINLLKKGDRARIFVVRQWGQLTAKMTSTTNPI